MNKQVDRVLDYLQTHEEGLTAVEAFSLLRVGNLASRITDLIHAGFDIRKEMLTGSNEYGTYRYVRYYMEKENAPGATNTESVKDEGILKQVNCIITEQEAAVNAL